MEVIELKKLFSNPDIQNMELKDLIEMINYKDFDVLLEKKKIKKILIFILNFKIWLFGKNTERRLKKIYISDGR